jgi:putative ATPase
MGLFAGLPEPETAAGLQPLAERMRPKTLDEVVGQEKLLGPGKPLRVQIENDNLSSMLFWGPPGCGKTTLARLIARVTKSEFVAFSAVLSGIKEIKEVMAEAQRGSRSGKRTIVFVDEVHRFNKAQQDAFLPYVEAGHILFIGATTENPSFEVISPLLSRTKVYVLESLTTPEIVELLKRALADKERGLGNERIVLEAAEEKGEDRNWKIENRDETSRSAGPADMERSSAAPLGGEEVLWRIAAFANGDARAAYNILELCVKSSGEWVRPPNKKTQEKEIPHSADSVRNDVPVEAVDKKPRPTSGSGAYRGMKKITLELLEEVLQRKMLRYDKAGEEHYNLISALHKSVRNSDPDAALYWLVRMIESGEDPLYLARRMVRMASEDIGLAEPGALAITLAAKEAFDFLGAPEGHLALAQAAVYLSLAPKSNAVYGAYGEVMEDVRKTEAEPVPLHLRNAVTGLMKTIGYGEGYEYAHDYEEKITGMTCLPDNLSGRVYYKPSDAGFEARLRVRMEEIAKIRKKVANSG